MIHRKILTIALAVFALVLAATPALASKAAPHRYSPKHGAKCHKHYKRVKHGTKVYCVRQKAKEKAVRPAATSPLEKTKLHSHLDPTFTRDPLNPFKVTYAYSAAATQETFSAQGVRLNGEEPAPLPSGVLSLYSDGKLECAINVGGSTTGSECPVSYQALGSHTVTTIYSSGEQSATETETEQIDPLPTTTRLSLSYADHAGGAETLTTGTRCRFVVGGKIHQCGFSCHFVNNGGAGEEECFFEQEWLLGEISISAGSQPAGAVSLQCGTGSCPISSPTQLDGTATAAVRMFAEGSGHRPPIGALTPPSCEWMKDNTTHWQPDSAGFTLTATPAAAGYVHIPVAESLGYAPTPPC